MNKRCIDILRILMEEGQKYPIDNLVSSKFSKFRQQKFLISSHNGIFSSMNVFDQSIITCS